MVHRHHLIFVLCFRTDTLYIQTLNIACVVQQDESKHPVFAAIPDHSVGTTIAAAEPDCKKARKD